jgi:pyridinium-3,5-biscarboxylic acid mononucleotide sulfurtransferase
VAASHPVALEKLRDIVTEIGPMAIGFSAGVDSTLLLKVAFDVLQEKAVAVTTISASLPVCEKEEAMALASLIGVRHRMVLSYEFDNPLYRENTPRRCYFCKSELFRILRREADALGLNAIVYGAQKDDLGDFRPGMEAAREFGARAPLLEAGLGKEAIRHLSRELGLPTWNKPAMACLASRIPHGMPVLEAELDRVDRAERSVRLQGFRMFRVRARGSEARLEVAQEEMGRLTDTSLRDRVARGILDSGFTSVSFDPQGYRPGGGAAFPNLPDQRG